MLHHKTTEFIGCVSSSKLKWRANAFKKACSLTHIYTQFCVCDSLLSLVCRFDTSSINEMTLTLKWKRMNCYVCVVLYRCCCFYFISWSLVHLTVRSFVAWNIYLYTYTLYRYTHTHVYIYTYSPRVSTVQMDRYCLFSLLFLFLYLACYFLFCWSSFISNLSLSPFRSSPYSHSRNFVYAILFPNLKLLIMPDFAVRCRIFCCSARVWPLFCLFQFMFCLSIQISSINDEISAISQILIRPHRGHLTIKMFLLFSCSFQSRTIIDIILFKNALSSVA